MPDETIHFRDMEEKSEDVFEATLVIGKRARQIIAERIARNQIVTFDRDTELEETDFSEPIEPEIEYEELIKATSEALDEFLNGELDWNYSREETP
tara:strand:+ start:11612 stop:11899 length:288 start_codon:yes stop_codon:yes gene_type:complete